MLGVLNEMHSCRPYLLAQQSLRKGLCTYQTSFPVFHLPWRWSAAGIKHRAELIMLDHRYFRKSRRTLGTFLARLMKQQQPLGLNKSETGSRSSCGEAKVKVINSLKTHLPITGFAVYQPLPGRLCYVDVRGGVKPMFRLDSCGYILITSTHKIDKHQTNQESKPHYCIRSCDCSLTFGVLLHLLEHWAVTRSFTVLFTTGD